MKNEMREYLVSGTHLYTCDCIGSHDNDCMFLQRLKIKQGLIKKYQVKGHIVPEWIELEVDEKFRQLAATGDWKITGNVLWQSILQNDHEED